MGLYYLETDGQQAVRWRGEPINGIRHPKNIEKIWTDAELEAIGLCRPAPFDPLPEGHIAVEGSERVEVVGGVPKQVRDTMPAIEAERAKMKVSRFQFTEALRDAGQLQNFINAAQAVGGRDMRAFEQVTEVRRNSNFIEAVRVQVGATQEAVDNLFVAAQAIVE